MLSKYFSRFKSLIVQIRNFMCANKNIIHRNEKLYLMKSFTYTNKKFQL